VLSLSAARSQKCTKYLDTENLTCAPVQRTEKEEEKAPEPVKTKKEGEWSDEEEEEQDEDEVTRIAKLREEKEQLKKRLAEVEELLPMEQPKESKKAGKQLGKLIKAKEDEERAKADAQILADQQVSLQRKIEESDFENAQDMFTSGSLGGAGGADSGKFESWPLTHSYVPVRVCVIVLRFFLSLFLSRFLSHSLALFLSLSLSLYIDIGYSCGVDALDASWWIAVEVMQSRHCKTYDKSVVRNTLGTHLMNTCVH